MSSVRLRRLQSDHEKLREYLKRQPRVRLIQVEGEPPERYQLEYQIKGLRQVDEQLYVTSSHIVEIMLPRNYPRMPPQCRMLTPVFHPNIAPHAICIGDHWSAGEPLWSMVARIGEMLAYQSYNTKSPLNGEAARWVDGNQDRLPLDRVVMFVDDPAQAARPPQPARPATPQQAAQMAAPAQAQAPAQAAAAGPSSGSAPPTASVATFAVECPACKTRYQVHANLGGKRVRCKQCQAIIEIPSQPTSS